MKYLFFTLMPEELFEIPYIRYFDGICKSCRYFSNNWNHRSCTEKGGFAFEEGYGLKAAQGVLI
ncbi:MAG: hypothetical protein J7K39_12055 [Bacteroidales bacterium]|nr:hypothetical protein [Bacteroidales bacterium]